MTIDQLKTMVRVDPFYSDRFNLIMGLIHVTRPTTIPSQEATYDDILNDFCTSIFKIIGPDPDINSLQLFWAERDLPATTDSFNVELPNTSHHIIKNDDMGFSIGWDLANGELDKTDFDVCQSSRKWPVTSIVNRTIIGETIKHGKIPTAREVYDVLPTYDVDNIIDTIDHQNITWTNRQGQSKTTSFQDISERITLFKKKHPYLLLMK